MSGKQAQPVQQALWYKIAVAYVYVFLWIGLSCSVILYNKYILDRKFFNWPFPISLTMIHMAFCSFLAIILVKLFRVVELPETMTTQLYLSSVLPIGALYAISLWLSNSAYIYLSVSFIQMLKALMPVLVYSIGVALSKDIFKCHTMSNMAIISVGVAIAAYGEANFNALGVIFQLSALVFEATRLVLIQMLLAAKGVSLNPITSLYYIAPTCLVFLTLPWFFIEVPQLLGAVGGAARQPDFLVFFFNCICAFALNLSVFLLIGKTSALTMNVAGVVKDWMLIAISWSVIADRVTGINLFGYAIAFLGVCWYNNSKLQEMKAKEAAKLEAQAAAEKQQEETPMLPTNGAEETDVEKQPLVSASGR